MSRLHPAPTADRATAAQERLHASYWLETGDDPERAALAIAGEQSSGTFVALPGETP